MCMRITLRLVTFIVAIKNIIINVLNIKIVNNFIDQITSKNYDGFKNNIELSSVTWVAFEKFLAFHHETWLHLLQYNLY